MKLLPGIALSLAVGFGNVQSCKETPQTANGAVVLQQKASETAQVTEATRLKLYSNCWDEKWRTTPSSQDFIAQDTRDCYEAAGTPAPVPTVDAVNTQN